MGNRGGNQRFAVAPVAFQIFLARTKVSRRIEFLLITMMNLVPYGMQIVTLGREVLPVKIRVNPGANAEALERFREVAKRLWHKWLDRRSPQAIRQKNPDWPPYSG